MDGVRKTKISTTISVVSIFIFCFVLGIIRWINIFNINIFVLSKEINSHITNFNISLMICTLFGYLLLCYNKKYSNVIKIGLIVIIINLIYETMFSFINTIDFIDAIYGIVGVSVSLIYLYYINKKGFQD